MLILTRRAGETIMIGDDVTITVLGVKREPRARGYQCAEARRRAP